MKKRSRKRKPVPVSLVQTQAEGVMIDALENHGYEVTAQQWDGPVKVARIVLESRGVQILVTIAARRPARDMHSVIVHSANPFDPAAWEREANNPDPKKSPIPLNPRKRKRKRRARADYPDYPSESSPDSYMDP